MIKVRCRTNIDDFKREEWPEEFVCRPMIGDHVQSRSGRELKIVGVTHASRQTNFGTWSRDKKAEPILIIELHR